MSDEEKIQPETAKSPTIRNIADRCGVNHSTVSRALRNDPRLSQATIERIRSMASEMGYDPMHYQEARRLISRRYGRPVLSHTLALFFYHRGFSQSNYFNKVLQGILDAVVDEDFEIHTSDVFSGHKLEDALPYVYRRGDIDGALAISQKLWWDPVLKLLRAEPGFGQKPVVGLVEPLEGCAGVYPDNVAAGRMVLSHLLDLGHRRIAMFNIESAATMNVLGLRLQGYRELCAERGISMDDYLTSWQWIPDDRERASERLVSDLKENPDITALIALNDYEAVHMYWALKKGGYRVPEDISLISYDDTDTIMDGTGENLLTTVRLPLYEVGREGTKFLIQRILGQEPMDRDIVLPVDLMVRKSTAPPRAK